MKMIDYLDRDRERLLTDLRAVSTPAAAQEILEKEADRLLLQYNGDCTNIRVRDAAAGMIQALRSSVSFMDTMGEPRVWRQEGNPAGGYGSTGTGSTPRGNRLSGILLVIGIVLVIAAFAVPALSAGGTDALGTLLKMLLLPIAGGGCLYFAGRRSAKQAGGTDVRGGKAGSGGTDFGRIEMTVDPEKLWNCLRGAVMVIDRNLEITQEQDTLEHQRRLGTSAGGKGLSAEEVELFSALLETADAESAQIASDIRYYLHKKEVDIVDWTPQYAAWFETLPGMPGAAAVGTAGSADVQETITIRPALVQGGKLLKKGIAVR